LFRRAHRVQWELTASRLCRHAHPQNSQKPHLYRHLHLCVRQKKNPHAQRVVTDLRVHKAIGRRVNLATVHHAHKATDRHTKAIAHRATDLRANLVTDPRVHKATDPHIKAIAPWVTVLPAHQASTAIARQDKVATAIAHKAAAVLAAETDHQGKVALAIDHREVAQAVLVRAIAAQLSRKKPSQPRTTNANNGTKSNRQILSAKKIKKTITARKTAKG
jgi:hypothetical protein